MNQDISGIFPLLEVQGVAIKEVRQEDLLSRMKWLLNASKSTPESFYLQLHAEEPPKESFYMLHAAVLALGDPAIMARWLQLEQRVCRKKVNMHRAHIRKLCNHYSIRYEKEKQKHKFKFLHTNAWVIASE
jgi:hypothetical protein